MTTQARMTINLVAGERRQLLLDPGSTLFVASGQVLVTSPFGWLAEQMHQRSALLDAEAVMLVESGGWIEVEGRRACQLVLISPSASGLGASLKRYLNAWLATHWAGSSRSAGR